MNGRNSSLPKTGIRNLFKDRQPVKLLSKWDCPTIICSINKLNLHILYTLFLSADLLKVSV